MSFIGRTRELDMLAAELNAVGRGDRQGRCVLLRGRRRVGKSRLVEVFCERARVPSVFYAAGGVHVQQELDQFVAEVLASDLPSRDALSGVVVQTWDAALRVLAGTLPADSPSIVVLDEVPYLTATDPGFEGSLQRAWDRYLSRKPVLLILIGSDLSIMEALDTYGRPFHQRGKAMVLLPLNPAEVAAMLDLDAATALDAYLITGGLPLICQEWETAATIDSFLAAALAGSTSALVVSAERILAAEFPVEAQARTVLGAIGAGERTYTSIQRAAGGLPQASLSRALELLVRKRVVAAERPLSTRPSRETRYRVADPYLRFWLYFLGRHLDEIDRGRGDRVLSRIGAGWTSWRGRAVEPVVRDALARLLPDADVPDAGAVGAYWTRTNDVEVDLVGADREPVANRLVFIGAIKWLEHRPFSRGDLATLTAARDRVPGADQSTPLIAVSRSGVAMPGLHASYTPENLLHAWPS